MSPTSEILTVPMLEPKGDERRRCVGVLAVVRENRRSPLPLAGVAISARVAERVATVTVTERFHNPYTEALEATYVFPLGGGCAVSDFELRVGGRVLQGRVQERGEARREYQQAIAEGKRAALLEQERDDVFTVQVGNLPPGEEVEVRVTYSERLPFFEDGATELRLPLVVAPRYIPGTPLDRNPVGTGVELDTDAVPDASRITPPRLAPGFDPKVSLSIEVDLALDETGGAIADLACTQHATRTSAGPGMVRIALARTDEPLDRDFALRWRLGSGRVQSSLLVWRDAEGEAYGLLSVLPPRRDGFLGLARDVVFVVDRSGSMQGPKMASAARACATLLGTLGPRDRFAIQAFDNTVEWLVPAGAARELNEAYFQTADEAGIEHGERWLRAIDARGGTELDGAIGQALSLVAARRTIAGRAPVVVVLTDGQVGDEARVLKRIQSSVGDARVFSVGIDTAPNDGFLKRLAALGGGTATFVAPGTALEEALREVGREIGAPLVVDVTVEDPGAGIEAGSQAPARMPDLFAGRAAAVFFRMRTPGRVRVRGRFTDGTAYDETVESRPVSLPGIAHLWARARVTDLEDRFRMEPSAQAQIREEIVRLAVRHTLLTRFTAFIVVDHSEVTNKDGSLRKVTQPVETPAQWEMEQSQTRVGGGARLGMLAAGMAATAPCKAPLPPPAPMPCPPAEPGMAEMRLQQAPAESLAKAADAPAPGSPPLQRSATARGTSLGRAKSEQEAGRRDGFFADDKAKAPVEDLTLLRRALQALVDAFAAARKELAAGRVPSATGFEQARQAVMNALATVSVATELPLLQRFLRAAAVELTAALGALGTSAPALAPLFERHAKALDEALREAGLRFGGPAPSAGAFWESTV